MLVETGRGRPCAGFSIIAAVQALLAADGTVPHGERLYRSGHEAFRITLTFCREFDNPLCDLQRRAILTLRKPEMLKYSIVGNV